MKKQKISPREKRIRYIITEMGSWMCFFGLIIISLAIISFNIQLVVWVSWNLSLTLAVGLIGLSILLYGMIIFWIGEE